MLNADKQLDVTPKDMRKHFHLIYPEGALPVDI